MHTRFPIRRDQALVVGLMDRGDFTWLPTADIITMSLPGLQLSTPVEVGVVPNIHNVKPGTEWRFEVAFGSKIEVKVCRISFVPWWEGMKLPDFSCFTSSLSSSTECCFLILCACLTWLDICRNNTDDNDSSSPATQNYLVPSSLRNNRTLSQGPRQQYSHGMAVSWRSQETARSNTLLKRRP